jgi:hypothetical protein
VKLKTFFALNEGTINEMAGMPADNPYNGFMYKKIMEKYGNKYNPSIASAWPAKTPFAQKLEDVTSWHNEAAAEGIYPSKEVSDKSVVAGLDWPFAVGSGLKSKNAALNMRRLAVEVGFATREQMQELFQKEQAKKAGKEAPAGAAPAAAPAAGGPPKMSTVMKTAAGGKLGGPPAQQDPAQAASQDVGFEDDEDEYLPVS